MTLKIRNEGNQRTIFDPLRKPIFTPTTAKTCTFLNDNRSLLLTRYAMKERERIVAAKFVEGASLKPSSQSIKGFLATIGFLMGVGLSCRMIKQEKPKAVESVKIDDQEMYMLLLPMNHL